MRRAGLMAVLALCACSSRAPRESPEEVSADLPDQIIQGFALTVTDAGVKRTYVEAEEARIFEQKGRVEARRLRVDFFSSAGEPTSTLTADRGTIDTRTNDMDAEGNAVVTATDGSRLETSRLHWDHAREEIRTDAPVTLHQKGQVVHGVGLVADPDLAHVRILQPSGSFEDAGRERQGGGDAGPRPGDRRPEQG